MTTTTEAATRRAIAALPPQRRAAIEHAEAVLADPLDLSEAARVYIAAYRRKAPSRLPDPPPAVWAVPVRMPYGPRLRVLCCCYCQGVHEHSTGYGTRRSHCGQGEYALTPPRGATVWGSLT